MGARVTQVMDEYCICSHVQGHDGYWAHTPVTDCPIHGLEHMIDPEVSELLDEAHRLDLLEHELRCTGMADAS